MCAASSGILRSFYFDAAHAFFIIFGFIGIFLEFFFASCGMMVMAYIRPNKFTCRDVGSLTCHGTRFYRCFFVSLLCFFFLLLDFSLCTFKFFTTLIKQVSEERYDPC